LSREIQVPPQVLEEWRRAFLEGAEAGLKKRSGDAEQQETGCCTRGRQSRDTVHVGGLLLAAVA